MITREDLYKENRSERNYYMEASLEAEVLVPLTIDGFEALLEVAAAVYHLPVDDQLRSLLAGYIHHIPGDENKLNLLKLSKALHKSVSNTMTWDIDQEAKKRELEKKLAKQSQEQQANQVIPINRE